MRVGVMVDDSKESQIGRIVSAFVSNPVGAVEVVGFIIGLTGLYWAVQGEIKDAKGESESNYTKLATKLDTIASSQLVNTEKIESIYARGDTRYMQIVSKLSAHDVDIAEIKTGVGFIVKHYQDGGLTPQR